MKKLFIFDCFGVIIGEIAPLWFAKHFDERKAKELKQYYFGDADRGGRTLSQLIDVMSADLKIERSVITSEFAELFKLNDELLSYISDIRKKTDHDVILLSNAPQGLVENIFEKLNLYKYFDRVFVSWQYKLAKPDLAFYDLCVKAMNTDYDAMFMIDDNMANLAPLEKTSITPVLYTDNKKLFERISPEL